MILQNYPPRVACDGCKTGQSGPGAIPRPDPNDYFPHRLKLCEQSAALRSPRLTPPRSTTLFFDHLISKIDDLTGIPGPEIGIVQMGFAPLRKRRVRIAAETAITLIPQRAALFALPIGQGAERTVVFPPLLRLGHMFHVVFAVMRGVLIEPRPHFLELLQCFVPYHGCALHYWDYVALPLALRLEGAMLPVTYRWH